MKYSGMMPGIRALGDDGHADHDAHRHRKVAGALEHQEHHGERRADDRRRDRRHADHHQGGLVAAKAG